MTELVVVGSPHAVVEHGTTDGREAMNSTTAESIYRRDKWTCQYCGLDGRESFTSWRSLSLDHLLPEGHTRRDDPEFIVIACTHCNTMLGQYFKVAISKGETFENRDATDLLKSRRDFLCPRLANLKAYWRKATTWLLTGRRSGLGNDALTSFKAPR
jgi:hypothetical protein